MYGIDRNVADMEHFLLECSVCDDLRAACPAFPVDVYSTLADPGHVASVMGHDSSDAQAVLANARFI